MIFLHNMKINPPMSANAQTSPIVPIPPETLLPKSRWSEFGSLSSIVASPVFMALFITLRGVAPVAASVYLLNCPSTGHEVICAGKLTNRKHRPTKAGLNGLDPSPPKVIFPIPMATKAPIKVIHIGRLLGKLNPNKSPVTMAEPSISVGSSLQHIFRDCPLKEHAGGNTGKTNYHRTDTEIKERHEQSWHKSDDHSVHIFLHCLIAMRMW